MSTTPPEVPAEAPPVEDATSVPPPFAPEIPDVAAGDWQPPVEDATSVPPPSAPESPADVAAAANPDKTISPTSFDVVAADGSTERNTPGYSHIPCPVCGNTSVKTTNVAAALPTATLQGDTVNPGDQVVVCEACSTTIAAGDHVRYEQDAKTGVYGDQVKAAAEGGTPAADVEQAPGAEVPAGDQELAEFRAWKAQQAAKAGEGGDGGNSKTESGSA
jgi:hypothetical protein